METQIVDKLTPEVENSLKTIKPIIESIVKIDQIILFGSRTTKNYKETSDYDLMLVLKKSVSVKEKIKISNKITAILARKLIDADIIVKNLQDIEELKDKPYSIVREAIKTGVVI
ncbi:MAG: nucleotidyltransferase domain-containing protein [Leptospiraceae bacterium]|nr:nucleotidyltransferase domain-containing protein [Leptospiraceae bacterium]